jgi:hypothetical protein
MPAMGNERRRWETSAGGRSLRALPLGSFSLCPDALKIPGKKRKKVDAPLGGRLFRETGKKERQNTVAPRDCASLVMSPCG